jgi:hypothetical protein
MPSWPSKRDLPLNELIMFYVHMRVPAEDQSTGSELTLILRAGISERFRCGSARLPYRDEE